MGFGDKWRKWIRWCTSTSALSVLVNGSPSRQFYPKRGLRQGCPLSPFLFILVVEAFSVLSFKAVSLGLFQGISIGSDALAISHLQFADDTLIFCRPEPLFLKNVRRILHVFEAISGLKVNFRKSSIMAVGVDQSLINQWAAYIGCKVEFLPTTYLGLPLGGSAISRAVWAPVIDRISSRLGSWKSRYLSLGGRLTLIKSVLSSLPVYYMSLFQLPKGIKENIDKLLRRFLWGGSEQRKKIHYIDWGVITNLKSNGGLGVMDLDLKNRGLLNKWLWRYGREDGCLWKDVIDARSGSRNNRLLPCAGLAGRCSKLWKNILKPLCPSDVFFNVCSTGFGFCLGNGEKISFWHDEWIEGMVLKLAFPRIYALSSNKEGCIADFGHWDNSG